MVDPATGNPAISATMSANSVYASYILSPDDMSGAYDEPTLMRGILHWTLIPNGLRNTAGAEEWFGIGLIKLSIEAAQGVLPAAALPFVPLPFFDADSPWIWQRTVNMSTSAGSLWTAMDAQLQDVGAETFQTRRKFENGTGIALICYYNSQGTTPGGVRFSAGGRLLWLNG